MPATRSCGHAHSVFLSCSLCHQKNEQCVSAYVTLVVFVCVLRISACTLLCAKALQSEEDKSSLSGTFMQQSDAARLS